MIFSLEVIKAKHGDCLLLHYGKKTSPSLIIIDGGPSGIYTTFLKPRLLNIKETLAPDVPLPISMVMLSHLDDDHINGLCMLTDELVAAKKNNETPDFSVKDIWFNSFDDIIGNIQLPNIAKMKTSSNVESVASLNLKGLGKKDGHIAAVIASTGQGRQLRGNATVLGAKVNAPFKPIKNKTAVLVRGDVNQPDIKWDELKITVLHPDETRLQTLQKQWDKDLKKMKKDGDGTITIASIVKPDTSPFNLSSIVCLVKLNGKSILLTGDARADDILNGLKVNKQLDSKGKLHVNIFKIAHHGSIRNAEDKLFEKVTADHYVISADGAFDNPDKPLLDMLIKNIKTGTLHLTYRKGKLDLESKLKAFVKKLSKSNSALKVEIIADDKTSALIDLEEPVTY